MVRRPTYLAVLAFACVVPLARQASADITAVTASGPGGSVTDLAIATDFSPHDSVQFKAVFTSAAPITFDLTIDGPGGYIVGYPLQDVTNSTATPFPSFYAYQLDAQAGSTFYAGSYNVHAFSSGVTFAPPFPNATTVRFDGPPGLGIGETTNIGVEFEINAPGSRTVEVVLTPVAMSVPAPSALTLVLIGAVACLGHRARRPRGRG